MESTGKRKTETFCDSVAGNRGMSELFESWTIPEPEMALTNHNRGEHDVILGLLEHSTFGNFLLIIYCDQSD